MRNTQTDQRKFLRRLVFFLAAMFFSQLSRSMTAVQIPVYLRELGATISQVGFFFTFALVFPLALRIFGGYLSDTMGRLQSLVLGGLAGVLTFAAYAIAPTWEMALLGPAFFAVTASLIFPSYKGYLGDHAPEAMRGRIFGVSQMVVAFTWIVGAPIGGFLGQHLGYRTMFAAAAGANVLTTLLFLGLLITAPEHERRGAEKASVASLRRNFSQMFWLMLSGGLVTWILIVDGVRDVASKLSFELMPVYLSEIGGISKQQIGLLDGIFGIALTAVSVPAGMLVDKTRERVAIVLGLLGMILSRLVFALAGGFWGFAFSWILLGVGGSLIDVGGSALIARGVPSRVRGITYALVATSLGIISLPAPWIGSQIWNLLGPKAPFFLTVILGSLTLIPAWLKLVVDDHVEYVDVPSPAAPRI